MRRRRLPAESAALVATAAWLVPRAERRVFLRTWWGELSWHRQMAAAPGSAGRVSVMRLAAGAWRHAWSLATRDWTLEHLSADLAYAGRAEDLVQVFTGCDRRGVAIHVYTALMPHDQAIAVADGLLEVVHHHHEHPTRRQGAEPGARWRSYEQAAGAVTTAVSDGREGRIRTRSPPLDSVPYRNHVAVIAMTASTAVAHCPPLPGATTAIDVAPGAWQRLPQGRASDRLPDWKN